MKSTNENEIHFDAFQSLLEEYESLQIIMNQFYFGDINFENDEKIPTRKYTVSEKCLRG